LGKSTPYFYSKKLWVSHFVNKFLPVKKEKGREKLVDVLSDRKNVLPLQQHAYPASRKNSALRVSFLFLYTP